MNFYYREIGAGVQATDTVIRPAAAGDLDTVAAIFGHYVTSTVVTFEVTPPSVGDWRLRLDNLAAKGLPFLVCESPDRAQYTVLSGRSPPSGGVFVAAVHGLRPFRRERQWFRKKQVWLSLRAARR